MMAASNTWSAEEESKFLEVWYPRFDKYFATHPTANKAIGGLLFAGCNPLLLARVLYGATAPITYGLEEYRDRLREFAKELDAALPKIRAMSEILKDLSQKATEIGAAGGEFSSISARLSACIPAVEGFRDVAREGSSRRLRNGSDYLLALLATYLRSVTGEAQWSALAYLIEAAYFGHGLSVDYEKDTIRNKIARLAESEPAKVSRLEEAVKNYLQSGNGNWPSNQDFEAMVLRITLQQIADASQSK